MLRTIVALALLCTASAWADCAAGVYSFTDADKKFMIDSVAAVRALLPPAPEGWRMQDPLMAGVRPGAPMPEWKPPTSACSGAEAVPLITGWAVKYFLDAGSKELNRKDGELLKKMQVIRNTPMTADDQGRVKELGNKDRDLRFQARKFERTDKAEADRLKAEALVYAKQLGEIQQAHMATLKPQLDALQKEEDELMKGRSLLEVSLDITVNGKGVDTRQMASANAQAGAAITVVGKNPNTGRPRTVLVYGGPWKQDSGAINAAFPKGADIRKAYNIVVTADGDPKQAEMFISKLDSAALKALLGK
jgi:hypothetical protein